MSAFNVDCPASVPRRPAATISRLLTGLLRHALLVVLAIALYHSQARAQETSPAASDAPRFSRILILPGAPIEFEGTSAPGDRIGLRIDGRQIAETTADADGRWRLVVTDPLPPGDHAAIVTATAPGSSRVRLSEDVRLTVPEPARPRSAPIERELDPAEGPPNAATRRRAAELARDAHQKFSEWIGFSGQPSPAPASDAAGGATPPPQAIAPEQLSRWHWYSAIAQWLARAEREYYEEIVAGLSDPGRRRRSGLIARDDEQDKEPAASLTHIEVAQDDAAGSRSEDCLELILNWLRRANRDYHDYVVFELALRGIEDPQQREIARTRALDRKEFAAPQKEYAESTQPSPEKAGREDLEFERSVEARLKEIAEAIRKESERLAEQQRLLAEERAAAAPRADDAEEHAAADRSADDAEERVAADRRQVDAQKEDDAQKEVAEATTEHQQEHRQEREAAAADVGATQPPDQERDQARLSLEQRDEEARIARALEALLAERQQQAPPAADGGAKPEASAAPEAAPESPAEEPHAPAPEPTQQATADAAGAEPHATIPAPFSKDSSADLDAPHAEQVLAKQLPPLPVRPLRPSRAVAAKAHAPRATTSKRARSAAASKRRAKKHGKPRKVVSRRHRCKSRKACGGLAPPNGYRVAFGDAPRASSKSRAAGNRSRRVKRASRSRAFASASKTARPRRIYTCQRIWRPYAKQPPRMNRRKLKRGK